MKKLFLLLLPLSAFSESQLYDYNDYNMYRWYNYTEYTDIRNFDPFYQESEENVEELDPDGTTYIAQKLVETISASTNLSNTRDGDVITFKISGYLRALTEEELENNYPVSFEYNVERINEDKYIVSISVLSTEGTKPLQAYFRKYDFKSIEFERDTSHNHYDLNKFTIAELQLSDETEFEANDRLSFTYGITVSADIREYKFHMENVNSDHPHVNDVLLMGIQVKPEIGIKYKIDDKSDIYAKAAYLYGRTGGTSKLGPHYGGLLEHPEEDRNGDGYHDTDHRERYLQFEAGYNRMLNNTQSINVFFKSKKFNAQDSFNVFGDDHDSNYSDGDMDSFNRIGIQYNY